jgi:hypothetical protein
MPHGWRPAIWAAERRNAGPGLRSAEKSRIESLMRARAVPKLLLAGAVAIACNTRGSSDQDTRPLPAPEPPPETAPQAAAPPGDGAPRRTTARSTDAKPAQPGEGAAHAARQPRTEGDPEAASSPAAPAAPTENVVQVPSSECLQKCQGAMQGCLATPTDGGVPGFSNVEICKKAFETCQAACAK